MSKLIWDKTGERFFETGVDRGVLYVQDDTGAYGDGVAWNGLVSVSENPTGGEPEAQYADNIKYLNLMSTEEFEATIEAFTYPAEFEVCNGSVEAGTGVQLGQQPRRAFGFSYRTLIGNDVVGQDLGYKIHLVYNALAGPSEKSYETINDTPEAITFSWDITTTPVPVTGFKPTASLVIDSTKVDPADLAAIEELIWGKDAVVEPEEAAVEPSLPSPDEIIALITPAG